MTKKIMKNIIYCICCITQIGYTQTDMSKMTISADDGNHIFYYENGSIRSETQYLNNLRNGIDKEYFENGQIKFERFYQDGELHGSAKNWDEDGQIKSETIYYYKPDKYRIRFHRYYNKNGQLLWEHSVIDGRNEGLERAWYDNGQIKSQATYKDGEIDGLNLIWYNNGQLCQKKDGYWQVLQQWFKDGKQANKDYVYCYD